MSKYSLAKDVLEQLAGTSSAEGVDVADAQEALLITLIQAMKETRGSDYLKGLLQYEVLCCVEHRHAFLVAILIHHEMHWRLSVLRR